MLGLRRAKTFMKDFWKDMQLLFASSKAKKFEKYSPNKKFVDSAKDKNTVSVDEIIKNVQSGKQYIESMTLENKIKCFVLLDRKLFSVEDSKMKENIKVLKSFIADYVATNLKYSSSNVKQSLVDQPARTQIKIYKNIYSLENSCSANNAVLLRSELKDKNKADVVDLYRKSQNGQCMADIINRKLDDATIARIRVLNDSRRFDRLTVDKFKPYEKKPLDMDIGKLVMKKERSKQRLAEYEQTKERIAKYKKELGNQIANYKKGSEDVKLQKSLIEESFKQKWSDVRKTVQPKKVSDSLLVEFAKDLKGVFTPFVNLFANLAKRIFLKTQKAIKKDSVEAKVQNESGIFNKEQLVFKEQKMKKLEKLTDGLNMKIKEKRARLVILNKIVKDIRHIERPRNNSREDYASMNPKIGLNEPAKKLGPEI